MQNKKLILIVMVILGILIFSNFLSIIFTSYFCSFQKDNDYKDVGIEIEADDIDYYTVYDNSILGTYKVYKIYSYEIENIIEQIKNSNSWSKDKFYEYVMEWFKELKQEDYSEYSNGKEELYYYKKNEVYVIFDENNGELHYFKMGLFSRL